MGLVHREGLEPSTYAFVEHCYYPVELSVYYLEPPSGIEPELTEYKTVSLPLTYRGVEFADRERLELSVFRLTGDRIYHLCYRSKGRVL